MSYLDSISNMACFSAGLPVNETEDAHYQSVMRIIAQVATSVLTFFRITVPEKAIQFFATLRPRVEIPVNTEVDSIAKSELIQRVEIPANTVVDFIEKSELINYGDENKESYTNHFKSSNYPGHPFPYDVPGIGNTNEAIFKHFGKNISEFKDRMVSGDQAALHASAIMKFLGDMNNPVSLEINNNLYDSQLFLDPTLTKRGQLIILENNIGTGNFTFQVTGEECVLKNLSQDVVGRYLTTRTITIFPPNDNGDVQFKIERSFTALN